MSWFTGGVTYLLVWWLVFFMSLPFGAQAAKKVPAGFADSAPESPRLLLKAVISSLIATVVWLGIYWLVTYSSLTLDGFSLFEFV